MKYEMESAMKVLAGKGQSAQDSGDALRFTQAALNIAHAMATHNMTEIQAKEFAAKTRINPINLKD